MGIFVTVYIFNTDVAKLMQSQSKVIAIYRKSKKTFFKVSKFRNSLGNLRSRWLNLTGMTIILFSTCGNNDNIP